MRLVLYKDGKRVGKKLREGKVDYLKRKISFL